MTTIDSVFFFFFFFKAEGSAGTSKDNQHMYLHVIWASHDMVTGLQ